MNCKYCEGSGRKDDLLIKNKEICGFTKVKCDFCDGTGEMNMFRKLYYWFQERKLDLMGY